jgi:dihydrofolate synthase/folylpolyglutamate synthase
MNLEKSLEKLFSLHTFGIKLGLENIQNFLAHLNNPQLKLKTIHVAGSNGKGSTASFISSILQELGYDVGLYTSPHFVRFNERIKINNLEIPDEYVAGFIQDNEKYIDEFKLTFFEVTTALSFKYFLEKKVDFAVIETGLGGRLDATNVINPLAVVITSISLEHTNILGDTIEKISVEKAGIIKNHTKVFIGKLPPEADKVIEERCTKTNSELFRIEDYIIEKKNKVELYTEEVDLDDWTMPLKGNYQKYNAALAGLTIAKIFDIDDFNLISRGIKKVLINTGLQGRYEYYHENPDVIFDSAHNIESVTNFLSEFNKHKEGYNRKLLLFGVMKDKAIKEMFSELNKFFDEIHVTEIDYDRCSTIAELNSIAGEINIKVIPESSPVEFVNNFIMTAEKDCLVVLGSMYLLGYIKTMLLKNKFA